MPNAPTKPTPEHGLPEFGAVFDSVYPPGSLVMHKPKHREIREGLYEVTFEFTALGPMIGEGI